MLRVCLAEVSSEHSTTVEGELDTYSVTGALCGTAWSVPFKPVTRKRRDHQTHTWTLRKSQSRQSQEISVGVKTAFLGFWRDLPAALKEERKLLQRLGSWAPAGKVLTSLLLQHMEINTSSGGSCTASFHQPPPDRITWRNGVGELGARRVINTPGRRVEYYHDSCSNLRAPNPKHFLLCRPAP